MKSNWIQLPLREIIQFKNGRKRPLDVGNIPVYGGNGILDYTNKSNCSNCVIIGRVGAYCGSVYYEANDCWVSDNAIAACAYNIDTTFAYYFLKGLRLNERRIGTGQPLLTQEILNKIVCYIPCDKSTQCQISGILLALDKKIALNNQINDNLQQMAFAIFDNTIRSSHCGTIHLREIAELNPRRALPRNKIARCIDMARLTTNSSFPNGWDTKPYNGGMRFRNGDTLLARITPCLENGKTAYIDFLEKDEVAFGSTEYIVISSKGTYPPEFFYCLARYPAFVDYAVKNMNGSSGRQRVSAEVISEYSIPQISVDTLIFFETVTSELFRIMRNNSLENLQLSALRDTLLPRLMSGELDVSELDI